MKYTGVLKYCVVELANVITTVIVTLSPACHVFTAKLNILTLYAEFIGSQTTDLADGIVMLNMSLVVIPDRVVVPFKNVVT